MLKKTLLTTAAAAAVLTFAGTAQADEHKAEKEKCYGVVKAGKNDCGSASGGHSCAGQAKTDAAGDEWVYVPAGLCDRLAGGATEPKTEESDS